MGEVALLQPVMVNGISTYPLDRDHSARVANMVTMLESAC